MHSSITLNFVRRNKRGLILTIAVVLSLWCIGLTFYVRESVLLSISQEERAVINAATMPVMLTLVFFISILLGGYIGYFMWHRRTEMLRRVERERIQLIHMVTHQLASPLCALKWWLELAYERDKKAHAKTLEHFSEPIEQLDILLRDLRDAQDVQQGVVQLRPERISLRKVIQHVASDYAPRFERKKINVEVDCEDALEMHLDQSLVAGVLRELIENAIDYSPENETVTVRAVRRKGKVLVSVKDNGCGIPEKDLKKVFQKYTRGEEAKKHKPTSTGLGLYIVKGTVEFMGGDIRINSKVSEGTEVTFALPIS